MCRVLRPIMGCCSSGGGLGSTDGLDDQLVAALRSAGCTCTVGSSVEARSDRRVDARRAALFEPDLYPG